MTENFILKEREKNSNAFIQPKENNNKRKKDEAAGNKVKAVAHRTYFRWNRSSRKKKTFILSINNRKFLQ